MINFCITAKIDCIKIEMYWLTKFFKLEEGDNTEKMDKTPNPEESSDQKSQEDSQKLKEYYEKRIEEYKNIAMKCASDANHESQERDYFENKSIKLKYETQKLKDNHQKLETEQRKLKDDYKKLDRKLKDDYKKLDIDHRKLKEQYYRKVRELYQRTHKTKDYPLGTIDDSHQTEDNPQETEDKSQGTGDDQIKNLSTLDRLKSVTDILGGYIEELDSDEEKEPEFYEHLPGLNINDMVGLQLGDLKDVHQELMKILMDP